MMAKAREVPDLNSNKQHSWRQSPLNSDARQFEASLYLNWLLSSLVGSTSMNYTKSPVLKGQCIVICRTHVHFWNDLEQRWTHLTTQGEPSLSDNANYFYKDHRKDGASLCLLLRWIHGKTMIYNSATFFVHHVHWRDARTMCTVLHSAGDVTVGDVTLRWPGTPLCLGRICVCVYRSWLLKCSLSHQW